MSDVLVRDVPDEVLAAIDANAQRLGISRSEYLRRVLAKAASTRATAVTVADLVRFEEQFADLGDAEVMRQAWQ
jgi:Ribbon-helix-helix protein, copG family